MMPFLGRPLPCDLRKVADIGGNEYTPICRHGAKKGLVLDASPSSLDDMYSIDASSAE